MLEQLKREVLQANLELSNQGLVIFTWGNVSGIDRNKELVVIKPSGVEYKELTVDKMVVVNSQGEIVEGKLRPSSDTLTHLELYRNFPELGGVAHTHSPWATAWAQAGVGIQCFGTTHADHFYGEIPCTRPLTKDEVEIDYELNTGKVIVEHLKMMNYQSIFAVLVSQHGPFTWGDNAINAMKNSVVLEEVAKIAIKTVNINPEIRPIPQYLLDKHYLRKHGATSYYGQED